MKVKTMYFGVIIPTAVAATMAGWQYQDFGWPSPKKAWPWPRIPSVKKYNN